MAFRIFTSWPRRNIKGEFRLGLTEGFVGKAELLTERAKYSRRHLPLLSKALKCKMTDLIPSDPPEYDIVKLKVERGPKVKKDGSLSDKKGNRVLAVEAVKKTTTG